MSQKKIAIILPGDLPVPDVLGGAIETIVQFTLDQNEKQQQLQLVVFSSYNKEAKKVSGKYRFAQFVWVRRGIAYNAVNFLIKALRKTVARKLDNFDGQILKWQVCRGNFDRVIVYGNPNHLMALSKVVPKDRLIFYMHANLFKQRDIRSLKAGCAAGRYLCVSEFIKQEIVKNAEVPPGQIAVIKNPIDLDKFTQAGELQRPADLTEKYGIRDDETVLLFVGRIVEDKGIKALLQALKSLPEKAKFKLLVVGSFGSAFGRGHQKDKFHDELIALAQTMDSKIIFTGFVHNSELPQYHALADMIVMPSLCEEAAGMVAMEAMASGLPVITTDAGGIPEYITEDCGYILRRDGDFIANVAGAIDELMRSGEKRVVMGMAGKNQARAFSPEVYYKNYVRLVLGF